MISYSIVHGLTPTLIPSYDEFTQRVFNFDLAKWRQAGYWDERYVPHSLVADGRIIANVSSAIMNLQINGRTISAVQIGAVGVLPEHRGEGFSRIIMEAVMHEYASVPLVFLFGGRDVREFYPKFGFRAVNEVLPFINLAGGAAVKEPINISLDSQQLQRLLNTSLQHSAIIDARDNPSFYWFHLLYRFSKNIYYIEELGIAFIARYQDDAVDLYDVLSERKVGFHEIKPYIIKSTTRQVRFHFTPDWLDVEYDLAPGDDDAMLFVYGDFPEELPRAKFPAMAHT